MGRGRKMVGGLPAPEEGLVSVVLALPHTHAGVKHKAGDSIDDVHPGDAALMRQFGVLADAASPTTVETPAEIEQPTARAEGFDIHADALDSDLSAPAPYGGG